MDDAPDMSTPRVGESAIRSAIPDLDDLEFIDRGGQGDAWRIRRGGGGDEVLKIIIGGDPRRVANEIQTMKTISHPRVMQFSESGSLPENGTDYEFIIGEYVPGQSIAARVEGGDWPTEREAVETIIGALDGLAAIHDADIVHRDFKPGNVALRNDDWSDPVILDLGLVKDLLGSSITVYPSVLGTVPFMAPEQLRKERAVRRSDVFAAGVTLFYLLTREHPFMSADDGLVAIEVLEERVRDAEAIRWPDDVVVNSEVAAVVTRMLAPDAFSRPRASMAADALRSILPSL